MREMPQDRQEPLQQVQEPIVAVVVPCYNEEAVLEHTHKALSHKLASLIDSRSISAQSFICYVDDGSRDRTWEILCDLVDSSVDCHANANALARNDSKTQNLNSSAQDSKAFTQNAEMLQEPQAQAKLESMDCHDFASAKSRNDDENTQSSNTPPQARANLDSSKSPSDSKILDEKCGLQGKSQGSYLSGNDCRDFSPLPHFSLKAESPQGQKPTPKPLICIPTYNEAKNIAPLLREIFSLFPKIHILIIDDNSTDGTQEILASLSRSYPNLHVLKRAGKLGLASAYIDGFLWGLKSGFSHFIQMDADFSHHPRYLAQTLANLPHFEVVINSRNIIGGGVVGWGLSRKILSRFGSLYARLWLGARVMDFTGGFNAYSARALSAIDLHSIKSSGYCFQIEMKYRAYKAGLRLLELPIIFEDRIAGKSKMSKTIVLEALWRTPFLRLQAIKTTHKKVCK